MSILIKGMKMPKRGERVYLRIDDRGAAVIVNSRYPEESFRAVELPPHGRLIDERAVIGNAFNGEQNIYSWDEIETAIDNAPTIIEAEGRK